MGAHNLLGLRRTTPAKAVVTFGGGSQSNATTPTPTQTPARQASQFAYGDGSFRSVFSPEAGKFWVDKTGFIPLLEGLNAKAVMSLRNRRMGKTLWKDTLAHYYDVAHKDRFQELFGHLAIGKAPTRLANTFHVLPLTFAGIKSDNADAFRRSLNDTLNDAADHFKKRYNLSFELDGQDAVSTFQRLVDELERKNEKLYVVIDEYDASINKALGHHLLKVVPALRAGGVEEEEHGLLLKQMENAYAEFFSTLKTACDSDVARCFVTGVTPLALNGFAGGGFNIVTHLTHDLEFAPLYGFTEADVRNALARLHQLQPAVIDCIMDSWRRDHKGYLFHPRQKEALYNPTCVLHGLCSLEGTLRFDPPPATLPPEKTADHLLRWIRSDPNSMPAEATLAAIKHSPIASSVIVEALCADGAGLDCAGGVADQFNLSRMHKLNMHRELLLSFMFYTGALTYVRSSANYSPAECKHALRFPNEVARKEFAAELQRRLGMDDAVLQQLRDAILTMMDRRQVEPFCQALSQFLLRRLEGRGDAVIGGEDSFAQAVFVAMLLARRPCDHVRKEYEVDPVARNSNTSGAALDVVYLSQQADASQKPQHFCFTLKNVKVQGLVLGQGEPRWEEQVELSRDVNAMGRHQDDKPVLDLALCKGSFTNPRSTVCSVLVEATTRLKYKYAHPAGQGW